MGKVLTDTAAFAEHFLRGCADGRGFGIEFKLFVNAISEIKQRFGDGSAFGKRRCGIGGEFSSGTHARAFENELECVQTRGTAVVWEGSGDIVPGGRVGGPW